MILPLLAIGFLSMGVFVIVYNYVGFRLSAPPYLLGQSAIGALFTVYLFGIFASSQAGQLADRTGRGQAMALGLALMIAGIGCTLLPAIAAIVTGAGLLTIGFFMIDPDGSACWLGKTRAMPRHSTCSPIISD